MADEEAVRLTVQGAEKRDAGRGIARLPESARQAIGIISGDTVVVEGSRTTVVKYWPGDTDMPGDAIRIDADTRANAGVSIGDEVLVSRESVSDARSVTMAFPPAADLEPNAVERVVTEELRDRPVSVGERIHLDRLADDAFEVVATEPDGPVVITASTVVHRAPETAAADDEAGDDGSAAGGTTYEDIGGLDEELEQVREMIELPLNEPDLFRRLGVDAPKGVLLYGPPGTGKTLIARAVANEVDAEFYSISGPEIMSKYKGESEERVREVFDEAEANAPAVVFFDEIDAIASKRDDDADVENRVVAQMLSLMDGLDDRGEVVVIGATNRVDAIDPALRRGGRFDREIEIGVPSEEGRLEILEVMTRNTPLAEGLSLSTLAERTHGFVGADLHALVTEAAMAALPRFRDDDVEDPRVELSDFETAMAAVEPSAMREFVAEAPSTTYDDVGGLADAKAALTESVEWPLVYDRLFEVSATDPPAGVLLYGPPGTGKTLLARALAGETDVNFIHVAGPELIDKYVGESEKAVREVFERARQAAPSILFFDEIDAIASQRGTGHEVTERVVSQLLTELDGLGDNPNLRVLAATNRREVIDDAILRPGRLDRHVEVPAPDREAREAILAVHTEGKPLAEGVALDELAAELAGYTGADIEAMVRDASMRAIREVADEYGPEAANDRADEVLITADHLASAREAVEPTLADSAYQ